MRVMVSIPALLVLCLHLKVQFARSEVLHPSRDVGLIVPQEQARDDSTRDSTLDSAVDTTIDGSIVDDDNVDRQNEDLKHAEMTQVTHLDSPPTNSFDPFQGMPSIDVINYDAFNDGDDTDIRDHLEPNCTDVSKGSNRLACWLWRLKVAIPQQIFHKDYMMIRIHDMTCSQFVLTNITSSFTPSSDSVKDPLLGIVLSGLSATCSGKYKSSGGLSGNVQASIRGDDHAVELNIIVQGQAIPHYGTVKIPMHTECTKCGTKLSAPKHSIKFTGSISAHVIDWFVGPISRWITSALGTQLCPLINDTVQEKGNDLLSQALPWFEAHLPRDDDVEGHFDHGSQVGHQNGGEVTDYSQLRPSAGEGTDGVIESPSTSATAATSSSESHRMLSPHGSAMATAVATAEVEADVDALDMPAFNMRRHSRRSLAQSSSTHQLQSLRNSPYNGFMSPVVRNIMEWINGFVLAHLNKGFLSDWIPEPCDEEECGYFFRGVSGTINHFTGGRIAIRLPPELQKFTYQLAYGANMTISIAHVHWSGIDNMDNVQLMQPNLQNGTLMTDIQSSNWTVTTKIKLELYTRPGTMFYGEPLEEDFEMSLSLRDIHVAFETLAETTDWNDVSVLQIVEAVRNVANGNNRLKNLGCLVSLVKSVVVHPDAMVGFVLDTFRMVPRNGNETAQSSLELDLDNLFNAVAQVASVEYSELINTIIGKYTHDHGIGNLNTYLQHILSTWSLDPHSGKVAECPASEILDHPQFVNFTQVKLLDEINGFLRDRATMQSFNDYLGCLSRVLIHHRHLSDEVDTGDANADTIANNMADNIAGVHSGAAATHAPPQSLEPSDPSTSAVGKLASRIFGSLVNIRELSLNNFDTLEQLQVLMPTKLTKEINLLHSSAIYAQDTKWSPEVVFGMDVNMPAFDLDISLNSTLLVGDLVMNLGSRIDYDLNQLATRSLANIFQFAQCAAVPLSELRLVAPASLSIGQFESNTSILIVQGQHQPVQYKLGTREYPVVTEMLSSVMQWVWHTTFDVVNKAAEKLVVKSPNICHGDVNPNAPVPSTEDQPDHLPFLGFVGFFFVLGQLVFFSVMRAKRMSRLNRQGVDELHRPLLPNEAATTDQVLEGCLSPSALDDDIVAGINEGINERLMEEHIIDQQKPHSLFKAEQVPAIVRHLVPILIVCTIIMLLTGNLSVGASVDVNIALGNGNNISLPEVFGFSLGHTIRQLYAAGIYPLLFLVVGFSGMWPYGKLLLMLRAWIVPTVNLPRRERVLLMLDALGKFSLVDTYVLVLFMVAFRYHLELSDTVVLDLYVSPHRGFYGFLLATSVSLLLGHLMLYYHRKCQDEGLSLVSARRVSVLGQSFGVNPHGTKFRISLFLKFVLLATLGGAAGLMCIGFTKKSFIFEFGGVGGAALGDRSSSSYSLLSIGTFLSDSAANPHSIGILAIQAAFFFYAVITPIACLTLLTTLMFYPLQIRQQKKVLVMAEIANAWSAVEVFALSIIAALLQISTFADFMIGDKCDILNSILAEFAPADSTEDPVCFSVQASVASNCWYLVVGVLLNSAVVSFALRLAQFAVHERIAKNNPQMQPNLVDEDPDTSPSSIIDRLHGMKVTRCLFLSKVNVNDLPSGDGAEPRAFEENSEDDIPEWRSWFKA